jgi:hypothetical protein
MSEEELVQALVDGRISRRIFVRRLMATGVSAAAALSLAGLIGPSGVAAALVTDGSAGGGKYGGAGGSGTSGGAGGGPSTGTGGGAGGVPGGSAGGGT